MGDFNNLKPFDRFAYENLYFEKIKLVKEGSEVRSYNLYGFYTKKICEIVPKLKTILGRFFTELDVINFMVDKKSFGLFSKFMQELCLRGRLQS